MKIWIPTGRGSDELSHNLQNLDVTPTTSLGFHEWTLTFLPPLSWRQACLILFSPFFSTAITGTRWVQSTIKLWLHCPLSKQCMQCIPAASFPFCCQLLFWNCECNGSKQTNWIMENTERQTQPLILDTHSLAHSIASTNRNSRDEISDFGLGDCQSAGCASSTPLALDTNKSRPCKLSL